MAEDVKQMLRERVFVQPEVDVNEHREKSTITITVRPKQSDEEDDGSQSDQAAGPSKGRHSNLQIQFSTNRGFEEVRSLSF